MVLAVIAAHYPALRAKAISFDDHQYLLENPLVQSPSLKSAWRFLSEVFEPSTVEGYYQPLSMISLMLDVAWGGGPRNFLPFHVTSLLLHLVNTVLIILIARRLFDCWPAATLVGLAFGVHPLTVEPIPWIGERKTLLAAAFGLGSILAYLHYAQCGRRAGYVWSLVLCLLAMMAKPTTVPLPLMLLLLDWWPLNRFSRRSLLEKTPFLLLSAAFALITLTSQARTSVATMPTAYSPMRVPLILCHNNVFYLSKFVWPTNLSAHYAFPDLLDVSVPGVRWGMIGTAVLIAGLLVSLRWTRALCCGWLIFFIAILPTMQIIGFSDVIASDKYAYFPSLGLWLVAASALSKLWVPRATDGHAGLARFIAAGLVIGLAAGEALAARRYYGVWQDSETLYTYMLAHTPNSAALHNNLALALVEEGRHADAIAHYEKALRLKQATDKTYTNLGLALVRAGRSEDALKLYRAALAQFPNSYSIHANLGTLIAERGGLDEAAEHYRAAIRARPRRAEPHNNLGNLLLELGRLDEAIASYRRAIEIRPNLAEARNNLGVALLRKGERGQAAEEFREAVRLRGDYAEARIHLGVVLAQTGDLAAALAHVREAVRLEPAQVEGHLLLARLLRDAGSFDSARAEYDVVLRLQPDHADARRERAELSR